MRFVSSAGYLLLSCDDGTYPTGLETMVRQVSIFSTKKRPTAVKEKRMSFNVAHGYCVRRTVEVRSILGDLWAFSLLADDSLRIPVNVVAHGGVIARC